MPSNLYQTVRAEQQYYSQTLYHLLLRNYFQLLELVLPFVFAPISKECYYIVVYFGLVKKRRIFF